MGLTLVGDIATSNTYWDVAGVSQGTKDYQDQVEHITAEMNRLTKNLSSLNTVYGSMLTAMGKESA